MDAGIPEEAANYNLTLFETNQTAISIQPDALIQTKSTQHHFTKKENAEGSYLFQLENNLKTSDGQTCKSPCVAMRQILF